MKPFEDIIRGILGGWQTADTQEQEPSPAPVQDQPTDIQRISIPSSASVSFEVTPTKRGNIVYLPHARTVQKYFGAPRKTFKTPKTILLQYDANIEPIPIRSVCEIYTNARRLRIPYGRQKIETGETPHGRILKIHASETTKELQEIIGLSGPTYIALLQSETSGIENLGSLNEFDLPIGCIDKVVLTHE